MMESFLRRLVAVAVASLLVTWAAACGSNKEAKKLPFGNVESPKPGEGLRESVRVSGWAIADQGVQRIDVYWDDSLAATTHTGVSRPDVQKEYPNARDGATSGFDLTLSLSALSPGAHQLTVQIRSNDDAVRELYRNPQTVFP
jgi:hypothetical protein